MYVLILFFSMIGIILFATNRLKIPVHIAPLFTVSSIVLILYGFTLCSHGLLGVWFLVGCNVAALVDSIIFYLKEKSYEKLKKILAPLSLYALFFSGLGFLSRNWNFHCWDEYMHWDPFSRYIYKTGHFFTGEQWFVHPTYVQGIPLFGFFAAQLTKYTDAVLQFSVNIYLLSGIFVFAKKWDSKKAVLFNFGFILLSYAIISRYTYLYINSYIADILLGVILASVLYLLFFAEDPVEQKVVLPILGAFVLLKDTGIFFAVCLLFVHLLTIIAVLSSRKDKNWLNMALYWCAAIIPYGIWAIRNRIFGLVADMSIMLDPREYLAAFFSDSNEYYNTILTKYWSQLTEEKIGGFVSPAQLLILMIALFALAGFFVYRFRNRKINILFASLILIYLGYAVLLVSVFLGTPDEGEIMLATDQNYYLRYYSSFLITIFILILNIFLDHFSVAQGRLKWICSLLLVFFVGYTFRSPMFHLKMSGLFIEPDARWAEAKQVYKKFANRFPENSTVQIIMYDNDILVRYMLNDLFTGERVTFALDNMNIDPMTVEPETFLSLLESRGIDTVFTYKTLPEFWEKYASIIDGSDEGSVYFPAIYTFDRENGRLIRQAE